MDKREISRWLARAETEIDIRKFGSNADDATVYLAGHLCKLSKLAEAGKLPDLKGTDSDAEYRTTLYGRRFLALRQTRSEVTAPLLLSIL